MKLFLHAELSESSHCHLGIKIARAKISHAKPKVGSD